MSRILILIVLSVLFYYVCKRFITFINANKEADNTSQEKSHTPQKIVKCAYCGTHIPEQESMQLENKTVCKQQPCQHTDAT